MRARGVFVLAAVLALPAGFVAWAGGQAKEAPASVVSTAPAADARFTSEELAESYRLEALASWQPEAGRIATIIAEKYPDDFVATASTFERFSITFTGPAPEEARDLLKAVPVPVDIIEGVGVAESTTLAVVDRIQDAVSQVLPAGIGFSIYPNPSEKTIAVDIYRIQGVALGTTSHAFLRSVDGLIAEIEPHGLSISTSSRDTFGGEDSSYGPADETH